MGTASLTINDAQVTTLTVNDTSGSKFTATSSTFTVGVATTPPTFTLTQPSAVNEDNGATTATIATAFNANDSGQSLVSYTLGAVSTTGNLSFSSAPSIGTSGTNGVLSFTPSANTNGTATFTLTATDSGGSNNVSTAVTVTITVNAVDDAPSFTLTQPGSSKEDGGAQTATVATGFSPGGGSDETGQTVVSYNISGVSNLGLFAIGGQPAVGKNGVLSYTAAANANGTSTFVLTVTDSGSTNNGGVVTSSSQTVTVSVTAVDDAPSFTLSQPASSKEDAGAQTATVATGFSPGGGSDETGQTVVSYNVSGVSNPGLFSAGPTVGTDGVLSYTATANASGTSTFVLSVTDSGSTNNGGVVTSSSQTVTVSVTAVDDAPSFTLSQPASSKEDAGAQTATIATGFSPGGGSDETGQTIVSYNVSGVSNSGLFSAGPTVGTNGVLSYTAAANANGTSTFVLTVTDSGSTNNGGVVTSAAQTVTVSVTAVDDAPSFSLTQPPTVDEDQGAHTATIASAFSPGGGSDETGQTVTSYNVGVFAGGGLLSSGPTVDKNGVLSYTSATNASGVVMFLLSVTDSGSTNNGGVVTSGTQTVTISINASDDAPTFTLTQPGSSKEDAGAQTATVATGFDAGGGESQTVVSYNVSGVSNSGLFSAGPTVGTDGVLSYTAAANANGTSTFVLTVTDSGSTNNGGVITSAAQTVTVSVTAVDDAPTFTLTAPPAVGVSAGAQTETIATGFSPGGGTDESGQTLVSYTLTATGTTGGLTFSSAPSVDKNGVLTYTATGGSSGTASFDLTVTDSGSTNNGGVITSVVHSFTIAVANDAPTVSGGPYTFANTNEDTAAAGVSVNTILGSVTYNDVQVANPHSIAVTATTGSGTWQYNEGGTWTSFGSVSNSTALLLSNATLVRYLPASNVVESATFTFRGYDETFSAPSTDALPTYADTSTNGGTSAFSTGTANASITVIAVDDAPSFTLTQPGSSKEDAGAQTATVATGFSPGGGSDETGQTIVSYNVSGVSNPGLFSAGPTVGTDGVLSYTATANANGTSTFVLTVTDSGSTNNGGVVTSSSQTVTVSVTAVDDAPSFSLTQPPAVDEDTGAHTATIATGFSPGGGGDETGQTVVSYNVSSVTNGSLLSAGPTVGTNGVLSYTSAANASGVVTFLLTVTDSGSTNNGGAVTSTPAETVTISINSSNDAPSFTLTQPAASNEDGGAQTATVATGFNPGGGADETGQTILSYNVGAVSTTDNLSFTSGPTVGTNGVLSYTAAPDTHGVATFTLTVTDSGGTANSGVDTSTPPVTVTLTVRSVNDEPSFTSTSDPTAFQPLVNPLEDSGHTTSRIQVITATSADASAPGDTLETSQTFTYWINIIQYPNHFNGGLASQFDAGLFNSLQLSDDGSGNLGYTLAADAYGTMTFTITVRDSGGTANGGDNQAPFSSTTYTVTVDPVADEPQISPTVTDEHTLTVPDITVEPYQYDFDAFVAGTLIDLGSYTGPFFQITSIHDGELYKNYPLDLLSNGDWLTVAEGAAGLQYLPDAGKYTEKGDIFGFSAQTSLDGTLAGFATTGPGQNPTQHDITVNRLPDFVSNTVLEYVPSDVTPGQRVFATVSWQNANDTTSLPQTLKIYRSYDGDIDHRDVLLASTIIPGVRAHHGIVIPVSWIATVDDSNAPDSSNTRTPDGRASSYLIAIVDEENRTGDGSFDNDWDATPTADYTVTVPDITVDSPNSDLLAVEGLANSGKFVFHRSGDTSMALTVFVDWNLGQPTATTTNEADFGGKYPGSLGVGLPTAITFAAGSNTASIKVSPIIDTNSTPGEQLLEQLTATIIADPSNPSNISYTVDYFNSGNDELVMNVEDVVNTISIKATDATSTETKSTTAKFRLSRGTGQSSKLPVTVTVDFGGTATPGAGNDYLALLGTSNITFYSTIGHPAATLADITIPAKKNFVDITIKPIDDNLIEGNETIIPTVQVDPSSNQRYIPGTPVSATANLTDSDDIRLSAMVAGVPQTFTAPTNVAGKVIRFTAAVANLSASAPSPATALQVGLLSTTLGTPNPAIYNANVIPLQTVNMGSIPVGGKRTKTFAIKLSSITGLNPGTYRIVAKADSTNVVTETNENDNYAYTGGIITIV